METRTLQLTLNEANSVALTSPLEKSLGGSSPSNSPSGMNSPGRAPWFDIRFRTRQADDAPLVSQPLQKKVAQSSSIYKPFDTFVIGVAGGSASGKTSVSEMVIRNLDVPWVVLLSMDSFYKILTPEQIDMAHRNDYNFDHPDAFDYDLLYETLLKLKAGKNVQVPIYDFKTHSRSSQKRTVYGANVIIFEGILAFYDQRIMDVMDLKVFVDTDDDVRLARRLKRDITERGRDMHGVVQQYNRFVKSSFDQFIRPTMRSADIIIPRGADNIVAIELLTKHIARQLDERGVSIRSRLVQAKLDLLTEKNLPPSISVLRETPHLKFVHTTIRNKETTQEDFRFYVDCLSRLVLEQALSELPFLEKKVTTPTGGIYHGLQRSVHKLCGVSIVRAGVPMEKVLPDLCKDINIGKLLIQTDARTSEPNLHDFNLPSDIADHYVLLLDATIATGAAAIMAIRILLDHDVQENHIIFVCYIASPQGLAVVSSTFPKIKIVVSEVDWQGLNESYWIMPGFGNFGDRYFGT